MTKNRKAIAGETTMVCWGATAFGGFLILVDLVQGVRLPLHSWIAITICLTVSLLATVIYLRLPAPTDNPEQAS